MTAARARSAAVLAVALLGAAAGPACRSASPRPGPERCPTDGLLVIRNYTGRVLEVYESGRGTTEFIGFASPGATRLAVRGPSDLGLVYHVREPAEGRDAATVSWLRPTAVARAPSRFTLELTCR